MALWQTYTNHARHAGCATAQPPHLRQLYFLNWRSRARRGSAVAKSGSSCVDVAWLKRNLEDVRVYDVRGSHPDPGLEFGHEKSLTGCSASADYDAYLEGHVPGAVFVNWLRDGAAWQQQQQPGSCNGSHSDSSSNSSGPGGESGRGDGGDGNSGRLALAVEVDPDVYVPCFEARGLSAERPVVVYDNGTSMIAARVWWQMLLYGHPSPYILHGGWAAWRAAGGAAELYEPCPLKLSSVYDAEPQLQYRATAEEFRLAATTTHGSSGAGGGAAQTVAVLVVPEAPSDTTTTTSPYAHNELPFASRLSLAALLRAGITTPTPTDTSNTSPSLGVSPLAPWTAAVAAAAVAAGGAQQRRALADRISAALGGAATAVTVGPSGASTRLLLASPHDGGLSACAVGALLRAAGHDRWAVCETL